MDTLWVALSAAAIGSFLIILNEWIKVYFERKKQRNKLAIWNALEQTGTTPPSLTIEDIAMETGIDNENLTPLLYEMIQEGTISDGPFHAFTRYRLE